MKTRNSLRIVSALLVLLMFIPGLISCSGDTSSSNVPDAGNDTTVLTDTAPAETTVSPYDDEVPELDFDGYNFKILSPIGTFFHGELTASEQTGEVLNDALYNYSREIESRFNIVITEEMTTAGQPMQDRITNFVTAGDDAFDLATIADFRALNMALEGVILNLTEFDYIDLTKAYWTKTLNDALSIDNKLFFAFGDLAISSFDYTHVLLFNSDMINSYGLENPQQLVLDGKFTYDKFLEMGLAVTSDVNGNGVQDDGDIYGMLSTPKQTISSLWVAAGARSVKKDENDIPYFSLPDDKYFAQVFDRIFEITWDSGMWYRMSSNSTTYFNDFHQFENSEALFTDHTFYSVGLLRDMEDDFGVTLYPKWDEKQERYYSRCESGAPVLIVPATAADTSRTGAIIEAMASASSKSVIPAYYETTLKQKYTRDELSSQMFDMVMETRSYDLGDTIWTTSIRDKFLVPMMTNNDRTLASTVEKNRTEVENTINKAISFFKDLG